MACPKMPDLRYSLLTIRRAKDRPEISPCRTKGESFDLEKAFGRRTRTGFVGLDRLDVSSRLETL